MSAHRLLLRPVALGFVAGFVFGRPFAGFTWSALRIIQSNSSPLIRRSSGAGFAAVIGQPRGLKR